MHGVLECEGYIFYRKLLRARSGPKRPGRWRRRKRPARRPSQASQARAHQWRLQRPRTLRSLLRVQRRPQRPPPQPPRSWPSMTRSRPRSTAEQVQKDVLGSNARGLRPAHVWLARARTCSATGRRQTGLERRDAWRALRVDALAVRATAVAAISLDGLASAVAGGVAGQER